MKIRLIQVEDNQQLSHVIKRSLEEFDVARPGTVYTDKSTDSLYELFEEYQAPYFVLVDDLNVVQGGCGLFPTDGLPDGYIEIVKLYLAPQARGKGWGEKLLLECIDEAKRRSYNYVYLETLTELSFAVKLYQKVGMTKLDGAKGDSGHFACSLWFEKKL
jgi:putative acetyltransferase